jgi:dolichyl-diphosphooligosaccharide--protein glycosyltransferase
MSDEDQQAEWGSVLGLLEQYYPAAALSILAAFMLWVRLQAFDRFTRDGEIIFSGNDPWYHFREVRYIVEHYPQVMPFDIWTNFAAGTSSGQFGTLFDQLIATAALVVGLGDPSAETVRLVVLVAPVVFATLVLVPTYYIGRRVGGRIGGVFAATLLAFLPGTFLGRGLVGVADHNIAEPLFQSVAVLATMAALGVAERERPVWEQVLDRDYAGLRRPVGYAALAGVATGLYMWMWPPGVLLVGILGVFYLIALTAGFLGGASPEHVGLVAVVSMAVTAVMMLVPLYSLSFSPVQFSLLQPATALAIAVGVAFMGWLAREWEARALARPLYPLAVLAVGAVGLLALSVVRPGLLNTVRVNLLNFVGFGTGAGQRTIGEAQPLLARGDYFSVLFFQYGLAVFTAFAGAVALLFRQARERSAESLLLLVWFAFILSAAFTQNRFNYYLVVPVAVLNGYLLRWALSVAGLPDRPDLSAVTTTHVSVVILVVLVAFAPIAVGVNQGGGGSPRVDSAAYSAGADHAPGGVSGWYDSLTWMESQTPAEGDLAGAGNADQLDYYGTYAETDDYDYPAGSYGVLSWWDYGHWITTIGGRIPVANPFQQNADTAANYLLAANESEANRVLAGVDENDASVRYVMIDAQMVTAGNKLSAPTVFYDEGPLNANDFVSSLYSVVERQGQRFLQQQGTLYTQRYYENMMVRLYHFHGSAVDPQPVVVDYDRQVRAQNGRLITIAPQNGSTVRQFDTVQQARQFVEEDGSAQIGGLTTAVSERLDALEHYRMVKADERPVGVRTRVRSFTKVFERVPGATVRGVGPANTTVTASAAMAVPSQNTNFTYRQRAETGPDGEFEMVLPYSTTGYEDWGPDQGYTNVSVRGEGPYTFSTPLQVQNNTLTRQRATKHVREGNVIGENESAVTVSLTNESFDVGTETQSGSDGSGSGGDDTASVDGAVWIPAVDRVAAP